MPYVSSSAVAAFVEVLEFDSYSSHVRNRTMVLSATNADGDDNEREE